MVTSGFTSVSAKQRYEVPRIAEGKCLELLYTLREDGDTLDSRDVSHLCPKCDMGGKCREEGKLTVYCSGGLF